VKWFSKEQKMSVWTAQKWLSPESVAVFGEHDNEPSGSIRKYGISLSTKQLSTSQEDSVPTSYFQIVCLDGSNTASLIFLP
jgi:hypothetical protein